jgi:hypothetical protein
VHEVKGQGADHESDCHLRRGKRQPLPTAWPPKFKLRQENKKNWVRFPFRVQEPTYLKHSSEANRTSEFANPRPHRLGKCDIEQASAEQDKTGNGHSEETVRNEFFAHGTPPTARKIDCDARKSQLPRRHQGYLRALYRQPISSFGVP